MTVVEWLQLWLVGAGAVAVGCSVAVALGHSLRDVAACLSSIEVSGFTALGSTGQELVTSDVAEQAARAQTIRRHQIELERLQARLDILYEDRLDGRIDASKYDLKAEETRGQQHRVQINITQCQSADLAPAAAAVDLISLTSKAAELFERQCAIEQRRLLRLVVQAAIWQEGELRDVLPGRLSNCDYRTLQLPQKTSTSRQMS
jgi:hypothetical protein